jgi:LmbE family N-acetylglucosaminyl deacetylase
MHPDHIAVHDAAVSAFDMAGDEGIKINGLNAFQPAKLYFHIFPRGMYRLIIKILPLFGIDPEKFGKNKDINLKAIMDLDFPTHASINYRPYSKQRVQASACYVSQGGDKQTGYIVNWIMRMISPTESYMRAYPEVVKGRIERDLFEGI